MKKINKNETSFDLDFDIIKYFKSLGYRIFRDDGLYQLEGKKRIIKVYIRSVNVCLNINRYSTEEEILSPDHLYIGRIGPNGQSTGGRLNINQIIKLLGKKPKKNLIKSKKLRKLYDELEDNGKKEEYSEILSLIRGIDGSGSSSSIWK